MDDYTLTMTYGTPAPLTAKRLAMWVNANIGPRWIAPAHYLKQFHPKYNTADKDFKDFNQKAATWTNPEMPSLNAWMVTKYEAGKSLTGERNPYYYAWIPKATSCPTSMGRIGPHQGSRSAAASGPPGLDRSPSLPWLQTLADIATLKDERRCW